MPNLDAGALQMWWEAKPSLVQSVVCREEALEAWPIDTPEADGLAVRLGKRLDDVSTIDPAFLERPDNVGRLRLALVYMKAGRRLRCLHWLAAKRERLFRLVLRGAEAGETPMEDARPAKALRASLALLRRQGALQQMFSPARVSLVLEMISSPD